jgi:hypothetical protein
MLRLSFDWLTQDDYAPIDSAKAGYVYLPKQAYHDVLNALHEEDTVPAARESA